MCQRLRDHPEAGTAKTGSPEENPHGLRRTIRFIWPPEIEGTLTLLNAAEFAQRIKAVVHGHGRRRPVTKAAFHVTRGPTSLPSFVHDVAWAFGEGQRAVRHSRLASAAYPLVAPEGGKVPLLAQDTAHTMVASRRF
jgi:hypothetical protein